MDSPVSSVSQGDSPREVSTTDKRDARCALSIKQESLCQRRSGCKSAKQHRHMPYDRSPGGSTCTSSDESTSETDPQEGSTEGRKVKRMAANSRERNRMHTVNSAFDQLRELVPTYPSNRKLSKIDTLKLACSYIEDLTSLLSNPSVVHGDDVKLYHPPEGFIHGGPTAVYPGMEVKNEYAEFSGCNYQHYRVHPNVYFSVSLHPTYGGHCATLLHNRCRSLLLYLLAYPKGSIISVFCLQLIIRNTFSP